jgi:uncharacterized protein YajQ (UPF0234 family)
MNHYVMDYETLANCFTAVFIHYKTNEQFIFVIHESRNDYDSFVEFLETNIKNNEWHISYNGLAFDAQITQYILNNRNRLRRQSPEDITKIIYSYAQSCINKSHAGEWQEFAEWRLSIKQIDIFKMNHWDNAAKRSSLKWIQFSMDWDNLLDMPIHHTTKINANEVDTVVEYCINDVESTKEIFERSISQLSLRKELTNKFNVNLFSASEPRIGKEIFSYYMSKRMNIHPRDLKKLRTPRHKISLKDIILPYIKFTSFEFQSLLKRFQTLELDPASLKGSFKHSVQYKNVKADFGLGGVHGTNNSGIYKSDDEYVIMSSDVTSFYPNLVIRNKWSPGHFPAEDFCAQYEWFFDERVLIPKSNPMNYVYKIILNSIFGLSNEPNSFFYDPELCMRITVNGQLSLIMLYEMIIENIPNATGLMLNTDGVEIKIPRKYKDKYLDICKQWENLTKLKLEHDSYQKLIIADVNSYIGVNEFITTDINKWRAIKEKNPHYLFKIYNSDFMYAPVKMKGRFNFHELALHKNKSKLIVRKAIHAYFVYDILPEDFINDPVNQNILDFCIGSKSKGKWTQYSRSLIKGVYKEEKLQKTNRYYISNKGVKLIKSNPDGREIQLEAGKWMQTLYNKMNIKKWKNYDVNTQYYISAIESEISRIIYKSFNQLTLL